MFMTRFNESTPVMQVRREMDRLFDALAENGWTGETPFSFGRKGFPALNLWETDQALSAEAELPGLRMDELEVFVLGKELTIKGERKSEHTEKGQTGHRTERATGAFTRVVRLPCEVDPDKVEAALRDGVLTVTLPKAQAAKVRKIEVKA